MMKIARISMLIMVSGLFVAQAHVHGASSATNVKKSESKGFRKTVTELMPYITAAAALTGWAFGAYCWATRNAAIDAACKAGANDRDRAFTENLKALQKAKISLRQQNIARLTAFTKDKDVKDGSGLTPVLDPTQASHKVVAWGVSEALIAFLSNWFAIDDPQERIRIGLVYDPTAQE